MSKQEETSGEGAPMVVEQKVSSQDKLYRPTDMQQEASSELYNRTTAPAVPLSSSERQSHHVKKSSSKRRDSSPENIAMVLMDIQREGVATVSQPIPGAATAVSESKVADIMHREKKADEDSIAEDIAELRNAQNVSPEWSGGLPRSESRGSRGSRVSRAVRQLFCCGVAYSPPSEDNICGPPDDSPL